MKDPEKVVWLSQTTLSVDETIETVARLKERFPTLIDPPSDDICYATQNRQVAVKEIAAESQLVIVVGSENSSNSKRLVEVAKDHGADASYLVDDASFIQDEWLDGVTTVGVTSGASVPEELVRRGAGPAGRARLRRRGGGRVGAGEHALRPARTSSARTCAPSVRLGGLQGLVRSASPSGCRTPWARSSPPARATNGWRGARQPRAPARSSSRSSRTLSRRPRAPGDAEHERRPGEQPGRAARQRR